MAAASDERRKAIHRFMAAKGLKPKPWAVSAHLSPKTLSNFLNRKSESLTHTSLEKLARAADATIAELIGERVAQPRASRDIVTVQGLKVQAAMGGGVEISEEPAGDLFYFRRNLIDRIGRGRPVRLRVIELTGDSMQPTLNEGDVALIDLNSVDVGAAPGVYCLWSSGGLQVKRVTALLGSRPKLRIQSDNRAVYGHAEEVDADEVRIIGRVVWRGGMV
jgi:phage repressor protein C with HTH and peptisase S24 domain